LTRQSMRIGRALNPAFGCAACHHGPPGQVFSPVVTKGRTSRVANSPKIFAGG
jgi:hypothetical protein